MVAPQVYAPIHQHFFNVRLDMMVDGPNNSVYEVNTCADPSGPENPHHNAFHTEATPLETESQAQRVINPLSGRFWTIANPSSINRLGKPVSYKLMPGENVLPFATEGASVLKRAGFTTRHLWVTPYEPRERYAAGDYPNQHPGGAGLPEYTRGADRDHRYRRRGLVHVRRTPRRPARGLAGHASVDDWLRVEARRLLRSQSGLDVPPPVHTNGVCH